MLRKIISWLIIIQHINVYVVHATIGDIQIIYNKNHVSAYQPSTNLVVLQKTGENIFDKVFEAEFETNKVQTKFASKKLVPNQNKFGIFDVNCDDHTIHLSSNADGSRFSLHLRSDGDAILQSVDMQTPMSIKTFGRVLTRNTVKSKKLSLQGEKIINYSPLKVEDLTFRGEVINTPEGQIDVIGKANLHDGNFTNQGRIRGEDRAIFNLNGNNFINDDVNHKKLSKLGFYEHGTYVTWGGLFTFENAGQIVNKASFLPLNRSMQNYLHMHADSISNHGKISSQNLSINCEDKFENWNKITAEYYGVVTAKNGIFNKKGCLEGRLLTLDTRNKIENHNLIRSDNLAVAAKRVDNLKQINVETLANFVSWEDGQGVFNHENAQINSSGQLQFVGKRLENRTGKKGKGSIRTQDLFMAVNTVANHGDVDVLNEADTYTGRVVNSKTGSFHVEIGHLHTDKFINAKKVVEKKLDVETKKFKNADSIAIKDRANIVTDKEFVNSSKAEFYASNGLEVKGDDSSLTNDGILASNSYLRLHNSNVNNSNELLATGPIAFGGEKQQIENSGLMFSQNSISLKDGEHFNNKDKVYSQKDNIAINTKQFTNSGQIEARQGDVNIQLQRGENQQSIIGEQQIAVAVAEKLANSGEVYGKATVKITGPGSTSNENLIHSEEDIVIENSSLDNSNHIQAVGPVSVKASDFKNSGKVLSKDKLKVDIQAQGSNQGVMCSQSTTTISGDGTINNEGVVHSETAVEITNKDFNNNSYVQSPGPINVTGTKLQNEKTGKILSSSDIAIASDAEVENQGLISGQNVISDQEFQTNNGRIEADENIEFRKSQTLNNQANGVIAAPSGVVSLPKAKALDNAGGIISKETISLPALETMDNGGVIYSEGFVEADKFKTIDNKKYVVGKQGIALAGEHVRNSGHLVSQAKTVLDTKGNLTNQSGLVMGDKVEIKVKSGSNEGVVNESISGDVDGLQGMIAKDGLSLSVQESFDNKGHMVGGQEITFSGQGKFDNSGVINKTNKITFKNAKVKNNSIVRANKSVSFRGDGQKVENSGLVLARDDISTSKTEVFHNAESGIYESREGNIGLRTNNFSNKGLINSARGNVELNLKEGSNESRIHSDKHLTVKVDERFDNSGDMRGRSSVAVSGKGKVTNRSKIHSKGTVAIESNAFNNQDQVYGDGQVTIKTKKFENGNKGVVNSNANINVDISAQATNKGVISGKSVISVYGPGTVTNEGDVTSNSRVEIANSNFTNKQRVQATGAIKVEGTKLDNGRQGKILSQSDVVFDPAAKVTNAGLISGRNVKFGQSNQGNNGRIEADKDVEFNNCQRLNNDGDVVAPQGKIKLDKVKTLGNSGSIISQQTLSLPSMKEMQNTGVIQSEGSINANYFNSLTNNNNLIGKKGVSLAGKQVRNTGKVFSDNTANVLTNTLDNSGEIVGDKGLVVAARNYIKQSPSGVLQSKQGTISLKAPKLDLQGELKAPVVKIESRGPSAFVSNGLKINATESFGLKSAGGWDLKETPQKFGHSVDYEGKLINPNHIYIKGDFTWECTDSLVTDYDIFVEGSLNLIIHGAWQNNANIQCLGEMKVKTDHFTNRGSVSSFKKAIFHSPRGIDNYGQMLVSADSEINIDAGSFTNHSNAVFKQKSTTGRDQMQMTAAQSITVNNSVMLFEGDWKATSDRVALTLPEVKAGLPKHPRVLRSARRTKKSQKIPESEDEIAKNARGSFVQARKADIKTREFLCLGSTFSTTAGVSFNGASVKNETQYLCVRGKFHEYFTRESVKKKRRGGIAGLFGKKKKVKVTTHHYRPSVPYEDVTEAYVAKIYSLGEEKYKVNAIDNSGDIITHTASINTGSFANIQRHDMSGIVKPAPAFINVHDYYQTTSLQRANYWSKHFDIDNKDFKIGADTPLTKISKSEIEAQIKAAVDGNAVANSRTLWRPKAEDVKTFEKSITTDTLTQLPPRIALITNSLINGNEKLHHHPQVLADLVVKALVQTIGFAGFSADFMHPLLLTRFLEEQGYLNACRSNGTLPKASPDNWHSLEDKLKQQIREMVTEVVAETFTSPAIVYKAQQDFGETVLSAQITLPKAIHDGTYLATGRILTEYLNINATKIENRNGELAAEKSLHMTALTDVINEKGSIRGTDLLDVKAGGTVANISGTYEGGEASIRAKDIVSTTNVERKLDNNDGYHDVLDAIATFKSTKGDLSLKAENSIKGAATDYLAKKDLNLTSGKGGINFEAIATDSKSKSLQVTKSKATETNTFIRRNRNTNLRAGKNGNLMTEGSLRSAGVNAKADGSITRYAGDDIIDQQVTDIHQEDVKVESDKTSWCGVNKTTNHKSSSTSNFGKGNVWDAKELYSFSIGNTVLQGITSNAIKAKIEAEGEIDVQAASSSHSYSSETKKNNIFWQSSEQKGSYDETKSLPKFKDGALEINAEKGVKVAVTVRSHTKNKKSHGKESLSSALNRLESQPGTKWIKTLRARKDIAWQTVEEKHEQWKYKQQGLTAQAALFISLAVGLATAGAGSAITASASSFLAPALGTVGGQVAGAAVGAGFQTLVSQASVTLINNQGDIGKTLKVLSSSDNLKSLATSMVTAGACNYVGGQFLDLPTDAANMDLWDHARQQYANGLVSAGVSSAIEGKGIDNKDLLLGTMVRSVAAYGAAKIGRGYRNKKLNYLEHKLLHGALGGASAVALGKSFAHGAVGPMIAECISELAEDGANERAADAALEKAQAEGREPTGEDFYLAMKAETDRAAKIGKIASLTTGFALNHDLDVVSQTTNNAVDNNFLGIATLAAITAGSAIWTAYDVIQTYRNKGPAEALKQLAIDGAITVLVPGVGKMTYKLAKLSKPMAEKVFGYAVHNSSMLNKMMHWTAKAANKAKDKFQNMFSKKSGNSLWTENSKNSRAVIRDVEKHTNRSIKSKQRNKLANHLKKK